eukprot:jgi/Orpsp1_1/1178962/evm.model.c7180000067387.1
MARKSSRSYRSSRRSRRSYRGSSSAKRARGNLKAANQQRDTATVNINVLTRAWTSQQPKWVLVKGNAGGADTEYELYNGGVGFVNIYKVLRNHTYSYAGFSTSNRYLAQRTSYTVVTAWDRTGFSADQFKKLPKHANLGENAEGQSHHYYLLMPKEVACTTYSSSKTKNINVSSSFNIVRYLYPADNQEKGQYISTKRLAPGYTASYYQTAGNNGTDMTGIDCTCYDGVEEAFIGPADVTRVFAENPCNPVESPSVPFKPTFIIGILSDEGLTFGTNHNKGLHAGDVSGCIAKLSVNLEFDISVTFRGLRKTQIVQENGDPYSGVNPDLSLYPIVDYELTMEDLYKFPNPPQNKRFIGPLGYFNLSVNQGVPRDILIYTFGFAFRSLTGNSNVPADDSKHRDNYRVRSLRYEDCKHTAYIDYSANAPTIGVALIYNISDSTIYTQFYEPGERYVFTNYEFLLDLRYMHADCRYRFWTNDITGKKLTEGEFDTDFSSDMLYVTVVEKNNHVWQVPPFLKYIIKENTYNIQDTTQQEVIEFTNVDFTVTIIQMVVERDAEIAYLETIDLTQINELTSRMDVTRGELYIVHNYVPLTGQNSLNFRYFGNNNSHIDPLSGYVRHVITNISVEIGDIVSYELFTDNGYLISNATFEITSGSGNRD